jgi:Tol biopolymer transport system component
MTSQMTGKTIAHYEIVEKIGSGGMGEVYRGHDTKLRRDVAIKVLPEDLSSNPERVARFQREARTLASLHHPHIASIFGFDETGGKHFLAMELVEGEDLAQRLQRGPLPVEEALDIARQMAEGLEAAHEKGIVHRDLKPANIKITSDGKVKILDFGLARAYQGEVDDSGNLDENSPTITAAMTQARTILGTAAFMSPEQARGKHLDKRTDIWAFGCVLYEMLTGRRCFGGKDVTEVIAAIVKEDPDWDCLPTDLPWRVRELLQQTLQKKPRDRLRDMGDAGLALEKAQGDSDTAPSSLPPAAHRPWIWLVAGLIVGAVAVGTLTWPWSDKAIPGNPLAGATFTKLTDFEGAELDAAISPDGKFVAFVSDRDGPFDVWVGQVGSSDFRNRTGGLTGDAADPILYQDVRAHVRSVGFSRDGSDIWLGGGPAKRMKLMPLLSGPLRNVLGEKVVDAEWSHDGTRVVYHTSDPGDPVFVADHNGANSRQILRSSPGQHQHYPIWSPDGQWIYLVRGRPAIGEMHLWRMRPDGGELERLTEDNWEVAFPTPIDTRTVLYIAREEDGAGPWLWALDVETRVTQRVSFGMEQYISVAASADGRGLVASVADPQAALWRVPILDRPATESDVQPYTLPTPRALAPRFGGESLFYLSSRGSGDGLWRHREGKAVEIWKGTETALLEPPAVSPDGNSVAIVLRRSGRLRLHVVSADGAELRALSGAVNVRGTSSWSPDGQWIVTGGESDDDSLGLFMFPVNGGPPERIADGEALNPVWSPDGNIIVYTGAQVQAFSPLVAIHPTGVPVELPKIEMLTRGERVRFLPDGKGLVYMQGLRTSQDFWLLDLVTMEERQLTRLDDTATMRTFDVSPDGTEIVFDRLRENSDIVLIELEPRADDPLP